jgi:quinol monooxygenase YgiN
MFSAIFQFNAVPHVEVFLNDFKSMVNEKREEMGMKEYEVFQMN